MGEKLAVIGSGEQAVIIADEARKMQIETHSFSDAPSDRVIGHSDVHHLISIFDIGKIVEICRELGIGGVIATTELTIPIAAKVARELGLNGMEPEVSEKITDKSYVRRRAETAGRIKQPEYMVWDINDAVLEVKEFPVIVKPTSLGGKRGISVVNCQEEMYGAIAFARGDMPEGKTKVMVERYIGGGKEYSVESISFHGCHDVIQVTEKITSGPPHCVELGHMQPAGLSDEMKEKVEDAIVELLDAAGVDNTTSHTEIKIVDGEIYLIELNARSGGDHISYPLTELSTGYSYIRGSVEVAMNRYQRPGRFEKRCCGVLFVAKQTAFLDKLFRDCEQYPWLYKKNQTTDELQEIVHNRAFDTNYFIYLSDEDVPTEIKNILCILRNCERN